MKCTCKDLVNNGDHYCPIHGTFAKAHEPEPTEAAPSCGCDLTVNHLCPSHAKERNNYKEHVFAPTDGNVYRCSFCGKPSYECAGVGKMPIGGWICRHGRNITSNPGCPDCQTEMLAKPRPEMGKQTKIDISNLRFYARMAVEFKWQTDVIGTGVIDHTLNEIANRLAAASGTESAHQLLKELRNAYLLGKVTSNLIERVDNCIFQPSSLTQAGPE